tara:strand:+ start:883 stop:1371 length:489 start_codon:yes stop_codon:yes gene_type:complete
LFGKNILKNSLLTLNYYENKILKNNINYENKINLEEETKYYLNQNLKVYIHLQNLISNTNIYHIGISYCSIYKNIRYDLRGYNIPEYLKYLNNLISEKNSDHEITLFWGYCYKTIDSIIEYEKQLNNKYILGIYDCRHYVNNLTKWSMNKSTPIWRLTKLIK